MESLWWVLGCGGGGGAGGGENKKAADRVEVLLAKCAGYFP